MKLAFFVSSAINLDESKTSFSYGIKRTAFGSAERFRQTQYTINTINLVAPGSDIFILDVSKNYQEYKDNLSYVKNLKFIPLESLDPDIAALCRTHPSKGLCEAISTTSFFKHYFNQLAEYDFIVKITGRYFFTNFDQSILKEENKNKYLFSPIKKFDWLDRWGYPQELKKENKLFWAPTCTYAIGKYCIQEFYNDLLTIQNYYINNPDTSSIIDYECMMYYRVLENKELLELPWKYAGWRGVEGDFGQW